MRKGILLSIPLLILSCGVATARTASATGPPPGIWGDLNEMGTSGSLTHFADTAIALSGADMVVVLLSDTDGVNHNPRTMEVVSRPPSLSSLTATSNEVLTQPGLSVITFIIVDINRESATIIAKKYAVMGALDNFQNRTMEALVLVDDVVVHLPYAVNADFEEVTTAYQLWVPNVTQGTYGPAGIA